MDGSRKEFKPLFPEYLTIMVKYVLIIASYVFVGEIEV